MRILTLVRVFLASPGDLIEERTLAKEAVDEINRQVAPHLGFRVELMGWEDTLPGYGRPQDKINLDLDTCELFLGIMWKKWGTPPSLDSKYSSGFEEEFERSYKRCAESGKPEMAMFFKEIDKDYLSDPGDDLKKVILFRKRLISEKSILFKEFTDPIDFQRGVREKITEYLLILERSEINDREGESAKSRKQKVLVVDDKNRDPKKSPFSIEGHNFLKTFLDKTEVDGSANEITPFEVARFRLLSSVINKSGNDKPYLGVHDANIIYKNKQIDFGFQEISKLVDCGLENIKHENVPLWHWYVLYKKELSDEFFIYKSVFFNDDSVCVGVLEAMRLCGLVPPAEGTLHNRNLIISKWLSESSADDIKIAALRYLKIHGRKEDLQTIEAELAYANPKTERPSLEAIISIQFQYSKGEAIRTAFTNQFEIIDEILLDQVLSISSSLDEESLRLGLKHRNTKIRLESIKRLITKNLINYDGLQEFHNDPSVLIRKEIVNYYLTSKHPLEDSEAMQILVKPKKSGLFTGLLSSTFSDVEGQQCYDDYLFAKYLNYPKDKLLAITKRSIILNMVQYFALCDRYFRSHAVSIRKDIDDQYNTKFEDHINYLNTSEIPNDTINKQKEMRESYCKILTRKAIDILCKKGDVVDLDRIRLNMRSGYTKSSFVEIAYLGKFGDWEDIPFILSADNDKPERLYMSVLPIEYDWYSLIASAVYKLGKNRFEDLVRIEMSSTILVELLKTSPAYKFTEVTDAVLMSLLNNNNEKVRKYTVLKIIQSFKKETLSLLLTRYLEGQEYRYYNVLVWLDFGVSMPKSIVKKAAKIAFEE